MRCEDEKFLNSLEQISGDGFVDVELQTSRSLNL